MDTKSVFMSKGVWGAVAVLVSQILSALLHLDPKQSTEVLSLSTQIINVGLQATTVIGAAIALYGRITATKALVLPGKAQPATKES